MYYPRCLEASHSATRIMLILTMDTLIQLLWLIVVGSLISIFSKVYPTKSFQFESRLGNKDSNTVELSTN